MKEKKIGIVIVEDRNSALVVTRNGPGRRRCEDRRIREMLSSLGITQQKPQGHRHRWIKGWIRAL